LLSLTISLSVESDNAQLLYMLLVLEHELTSGVRYLDDSNIALTVNIQLWPPYNFSSSYAPETFKYLHL